MSAPFVHNQILITELFGYWPSFHDAEVSSLCLRRNEPGGWPTVSLWLDVAGPVEVSSSEAKASTLWRVELEFTEVIDNEFDGFNHQNVIFSLSFQQDEDRIICSIETSYGLSGSITARRIAVKSLAPVAKIIP